MRYHIHTTGFKFIVPSVPTLGICGTWDEKTSELLRPDPGAIRAALPYRWRKAFDRSGGNFWFDKYARWNGERQTGETAHLTLHDYRGQYMATLYAIAGE